jgi:signal transduction histidine kinase
VTPQVIRRHVTAKFVIAFLVVTLVIALVGGVNYFQSQQTVESNAKAELQSQSELRATLQSQWVKNVKTQTELISSTVRPVDLSLANAKPEPNDGAVDIIEIHYVNTTTEEILASTNQELSGQSLDTVAQPWVRTIRTAPFETTPATNVWLPEESYDRGGTQVVGFVSRASERGSAVVVVAKNENLLERFTQDTEVTSTVYNSEGQLLFGDETEFTSTSLSQEPLEEGKSRLVEDGDRLLVFSPVDGTNWVVTTVASKSNVLQPSRTIGTNVVSIVIASLIALLVVGTVLGRHTVRPLNRLRRGTQRIATGEFDIDLSTSRTDEIGQLYADFDVMREELDSRIRQIEQVNEEISAQKQTLEAKNRQLELINRVVRHDISNSMNVIELYTDLLEDHVEGDAREHLEKVKRHEQNVVNITQTVSNLLSVLEGEDQELESVNLESHLRPEIEDVDDTFDEAIIERDDTIPAVMVQANEMLSSVFRNILQNAIKHNDKETPEVRVSVSEQEESVVVSIADNGPGIPPERRETVLGRGEKGLESSGTGVGLYLVDTLVEHYDGELRIESNDPEGTVFNVTLHRTTHF